MGSLEQGGTKRRRAEELFHQVANLPAEERTAYLDDHCALDAPLRAQVERLLARCEHGTMASLAQIDRLDRLDCDLVGQHIGPYRLVQLVGEGGFGSVYLAEQEEPVRRNVALKIIKLGMDTRRVVGRFELEGQALAMMEHPNIARVYDAGATDTGRPYFVMEFVSGVPITEFCNRNGLPMRQRLELFVHVCGAVQHAHQKGIIHRDIKPSNIMVTSDDDTPVPKIIDFGIAKAMSEHRSDGTFSTGCAQLIGTPAYMSPEQAQTGAGASSDIDTRTDIYSLGVLLYELLTGTTPLDASKLRDAGYGEIQRKVREQEPLTPSQRVSTLGRKLAGVAESRRVEPQALSKLMRGDLDWIVMKALEKDRMRRYETAAGLAADIQRHLANEPVLAGPPGRSYRLYKFIRRNRVSVSAGAVVAVALLIGCTLATIGLIKASRERDRALLAEQRTQREAEHARIEAQRAARETESARAINAFFNDMLASVDPMQLRLLSVFAPHEQRTPAVTGGFTRDVSVAEMVRGATAHIDEAFAGKPELEATARETMGMTLRGLGRYVDAKPQLQMAFDIRRRTLGNDHPDTLRAAAALAEVLADARELAEAEPLARTAYEGMQRIFGDEHPKTLGCAALLASVLSHQGKSEESEPLFQSTLDAQRRILGPEHRDTLVTMWKWSFSCLFEGRPSTGQQLARELHEICRRTLSPNDSLAVLCQPLMGWWFVAQYDYDRAESILRPGVHQCQRILGRDHPFTYAAMHALARSLHRSELQAEKEQLLTEALRGLRASQGGLYWQTISTATDLSRWLAAQGRFAEAQQQYRALLVDCVHAWGEEHGRTLGYMAEFAVFLERVGKVDEAIDAHRERLAIVRRRFGRESATALWQMSRFAEALNRVGRVAQSRSVAQDVLASRRDLVARSPADYQALNGYAWSLLTCIPVDLRDPAAALPLAEEAARLSGRSEPRVLDTLALAYHLTGRYDESVATQEEAAALYPSDSLDRLMLMSTLARFLVQKGEAETARRTGDDAARTFRTALGEGGAVVAVQLNHAGAALRAAGSHSMAEALFREALALNRQHLGELHENLAQTLVNLATVWSPQGRYDDAERAYREALVLYNRLLGDDNLVVAEVLHSLGLVLREGDDPAAAAAALRESLDVYRRLGAEGIPAAIAAEEDLTSVLAELGPP